jgi:hypothetical protein
LFDCGYIIENVTDMPDATTYRAAAWSSIGGGLLSIGVVTGGVLATVAASAHLWGHLALLAGFVVACLLAALGVYVLIAEFISDLPLPPTRHERGRNPHSQIRKQIDHDGSQLAGISASQDIRAGGSIATKAGITAGGNVEAGGDIMWALAHAHRITPNQQVDLLGGTLRPGPKCSATGFKSSSMKPFGCG